MPFVRHALRQFPVGCMHECNLPAEVCLHCACMQIRWEFPADIQRTEQTQPSRKLFPAWHAGKKLRLDPQEEIDVQDILETGSTKPLKVQVWRFILLSIKQQRLICSLRVQVCLLKSCSLVLAMSGYCSNVADDLTTVRKDVIELPSFQACAKPASA